MFGRFHNMGTMPTPQRPPPALPASLAAQLEDEPRVYRVRLREGGKTSGKLRASVGGMSILLFSGVGHSRPPMRSFSFARCWLQLLETGLSIYDANVGDEAQLVGDADVLAEMTATIASRF